MQKCCPSSARSLLLHDRLIARQSLATSSRHFSLSSTAREADISKPSNQRENHRGSTQSRDNGVNTKRPTVTLFQSRVVDLSASTGPRPSSQTQDAFREQPAQTTLVESDQPLRILRRPVQTTIVGVDQPLRILRDPGPESRLQSNQGPGRPGVVDARRAAATPDGQRLLLRRSFQPRNGPPRSASGQSNSVRGRGPLSGLRGQKPTQTRRRRRDSDNRKDDDDEDPLDIHERMFGAKPEPKPVAYQPEAITMEELRLDWPATAMDGTGLAESAQQKLEHLAKRIPHGYLSPHELAERFHKGQMVHFESAEERKEVLAIATELATARADMLSERKGEPIAPDDMSFVDISAEEKRQLGAKMVKGDYPALQTQKLPFLNHVTTLLRNNGTYHDVESSKFMEKVQSLLPGNRGGQQAQTRA